MSRLNTPDCTLSGVTSPDVPGLLPVVSSPVPSSFNVRRNSLLRSGPRRISFSLDGAMSMGGVVLEGCCSWDTQEEIKLRHWEVGQHYPNCLCEVLSIERQRFSWCLHLFCGVVLWCADCGARFGCRDGAGKDWIPAWHVKTWLCDLSTTGFPLSALGGKQRQFRLSLHYTQTDIGSVTPYSHESRVTSSGQLRRTSTTSTTSTALLLYKHCFLEVVCS